MKVSRFDFPKQGENNRENYATRCSVRMSDGWDYQSVEEHQGCGNHK